EVFAAVRQEYGVERDATLQLRDFPTLNHVAGWIRDKTGLPATPTPAPAAAPAAPAPGSAAGGDPVLAKVTDIVAEMTGYPVDLLDPDLDLEADLGVDTVKQAEVFAAVRQEYGVERDATLQLRDFPTLNHVAGWIRDKTGLPATAAAAPAAAQQPPAHQAPHTGGDAQDPHAPTMSMVRGDLAATDALPRRIPVPALRPAANACSETGVTLDGSRVVVMLDEGGVGQALVRRLEQAGATPLTLLPGVPMEQLSATLDSWLAGGAVSGVYWLAALDAEGDAAEMDLATWTGALQRRVKALYATMRRMWADSPFLVAATRLGGYHGYDRAGATNPMGGAVTGFAKSYKKERPDALVKAVDFSPSRKTAALADILVEETLYDPGAVEVGRTDEKRWGVALAERPFTALDGIDAAEDAMNLGPDSVVVVTGAAGSIVSAITADLAAASRGTFHLLDLTPEPDRDDPDLVAFATDRESLKGTLADRIRSAGQRPTPVSIEKEMSRLERLASAAAAIDAVESAGGTAHYHCVDLTDADAVAAVGRRITETTARVDVLLHAAGLEISRNLPEKEPHEFDLVFDVKTTGWFTLWQALRGLEIGAAVVFSSVAGRFGNQGQTDYSSANDLLCKVASGMRRTRPKTRALALDWTAWGGIGMATRGSIPRIMELAGVEMLPPEAGVAWIRRELTAGDFSGEVVVAGALGMMAAEYAESGGVDGEKLRRGRAQGPMTGEVSCSVHRGFVVTTALDPHRQPFLDHHRIDGTPVLPGVMGMEAFAETADLVAPEGYRVAAVEHVSFHAPVKFYRDEPRTVTVYALVHPAFEGDDLLVDCALTAERTLPGHDTPTVTTHFTGTVRLTTAEAEAESIDPVGEPQGRQLTADEVYRLYFHGPAYQVVGGAWAANGAAVARLREDLPEDRTPADAPVVGAPRLAELGFQAAGLWEAGREGRLALPHRVGSLRVRPEAGSNGRRYAVARQTGESTFDLRVVDENGRVLVRLDDYVSIPLPVPLDPDVAAPLRQTFGT
ncbi:SDR family NAD(P)-dependent oxidoreductase, partial [Nostocoides sp. F2B08]|uniref:SDR family oxidoreductase n=1 Tax=Nostocoides sp. F2B08 TaxID=2653936 RepID=UPI001263CE32